MTAINVDDAILRSRFPTNGPVFLDTGIHPLPRALTCLPRNADLILGHAVICDCAARAWLEPPNARNFRPTGRDLLAGFLPQSR
jgi:hypothetical protein